MKNSEEVSTFICVLSMFYAIHRIGVLRVLATDLQSATMIPRKCRYILLLIIVLLTVRFRTVLALL